MPSLHSPTHHPRQLSMRVGAGLATLGALMAVGAIALLVALAGGERVGTASGAIHRAQPRAQTRSVATVPATFKGFYQDPTTRNGWPTLASVLAPLTPRQRRYVVGIASLSYPELAGAFGTGR